MRALVTALVLLPMAIHGQEHVRPGESAQQRDAQAALLALYRRPEVANACAKEPDGYITVRLNGSDFTEITVSCRTRREYLETVEGKR